MVDAIFDKYADLLSGMNRAVVKGYKAPHKVVLLMSICDLVAEGDILDNKIYLTTHLEYKFKELWKKYVDSDEKIVYDKVAEELFGGEKKTYPFKCNIANPYFHLSGEPFWTLKKTTYWRHRLSYSVSALRTDYEYAIIDDDLFELFVNDTSRNRILSLLISML